MSNKATRLGSGLATRSHGGASYEVRRAVAATLAEVGFERMVEAMNAQYDAEAIAYAAMALNRARIGKGVAWVNGVEYRRTAGDVASTRQARGRVVVVQVNSKLCLMHVVG
jgi:hypothetical protein